MATPQEGQPLSIMMADPAWTLPPVKRGQRGLCRAWTTTDQSQCTLDRLADASSGRGGANQNAPITNSIGCCVKYLI